MDREKVIRIIDELIFEAQKAPTWKAENALRCLKKELLKEQEAVEPKHNPLSPTDWFCGKCGMCISRFHDYCPSCGREVKWE